MNLVFLNIEKWRSAIYIIQSHGGQRTKLTTTATGGHYLYIQVDSRKVILKIIYSEFIQL